MFRRSFVLVLAALFVAGLAMLPGLANPASGAVVSTRAGQVTPTSLTAGGTTRFCGAGFAGGAAVDVMVGGRAAQRTQANQDGAFCVSLRASDQADGRSRLLAVGRSRDGGLLNVTGGVAIAGSELLRGVGGPSIGPLASSDSPLVIELWAAYAVAGLLVGVTLIAVQRRRSHPPVGVTSTVTE
jgi:membrane protein implicated in regulation of membrane protease activity